MGSICDECEAQAATIECASCDMRLCGPESDDCDAAVHSAKAKKGHVRVPYSAAPPTPSTGGGVKSAVCDVCDGPANIWYNTIYTSWMI